MKVAEQLSEYPAGNRCGNLTAVVDTGRIINHYIDYQLRVLYRSKAAEGGNIVPLHVALSHFLNLLSRTGLAGDSIALYIRLVTAAGSYYLLQHIHKSLIRY